MLLLSKVVSDPLVVSVPDAGHCDRKRSHANHAFRSWHKEVHYIKYLSTHIGWIMLECQRLAQGDIADVLWRLSTQRFVDYQTKFVVDPGCYQHQQPVQI